MASNSPFPLDAYPPIGFGPSREIVAWDQGEDFFPPDPLEWVLDYDEDDDPTLVLLDAVKEDFCQQVKVARPKTKGKRELLNLKNSINYGNVNTSVQRGKGKAHVR